MPPLTPDRIRDDLRGEFRGRVLIDAVSRHLYSTDASPFQITPVAVAVPLGVDDLRTLVAYAQEARLPLIMRGAGTGLAGEALGAGVVVDLSTHFRRVLAIGSDTVTAEAGVTHAELNAALARHGRRFAPDPDSSATCTIGGMVGTNASGGNAFKHGPTRDYVCGLNLVWDDGEPCSVLLPVSTDRATDRSGLGGLPERSKAQTQGLRTTEIHAQTAALLAGNRQLLTEAQPRTRFDRCGYVLHDVLTPAGVDLPRLLTGSEGTLGIVTAATFRTVPLPGGTSETVLGFPTVDAGIRAGLSLRGADGLVRCDLIDARHLAVARSGAVGDEFGAIPAEVGAALVLTFEAESARGAESAGRSAAESLRPAHPCLMLAEPTADADGLARIRRFHSAAVGGLAAIGPGPRPTPFAEDTAVPTEELPRFLLEIRECLRRADITAAVRVRVPAGQVQVRPFIDLADPADRAKMWPLADAIHNLAIALGGTVSTQHGTGLARTPWVERQAGPLLPIFRELKRIFDPHDILNPGKIVGLDPTRPAWPLRAVGGRGPVGGQPTTGAGATSPSRISLLTADPWPLTAACNGCGDCRVRAAPARMCPVFHVTGDEAATPRAKANLFRQLLTADPAEPTDWPAVRAVADLCVNCRMCRHECRAGVDVPTLIVEARAQDFAARGLDRVDWVMARVESLMALAGNFAFTTNLLLGSRPTRWAIEKLFGLSRQRTLPRFTHRTFLRRAKRAGLTQFRGKGRWGGSDGGPAIAAHPSPLAPVAYFVDNFANYNDPLIGEAMVAVLRWHGIEVVVPRRQKGGGLAPLNHGDAETAREVATHNVRVLANLVREGYRVVCSEPAAALALTQEYPRLLADDPDARLVAEHTLELTAYLWELHRSGQLRQEFRRLDLTLGHHVPCHLKALGGPAAGPKLLELIPGVRVRTIDLSCSGMAGTWGMRAGNYAASLAAGKPMLDELRRPGVLFGSTECGTCRMQMQEGCGKRTLHPVQYLAYAYGLLPEIEARLAKPLGKLVTD